jgi:hypothetical protein
MKLLGFNIRFQLTCLLLAGTFSFPASRAFAQVSPNEILDPDLSALEKEYFSQLKESNQAVSKMQFPFPFYLTRYVGLDPARQTEADTRGLEFVRFQDRVLLKITGNYSAAYDANHLTENERATRSFRDVVLPILQTVAAGLPPDLHCDGIGFEISYHSRARNGSYDYEGKEILVVVLDRNDAWTLVRAATDADRQDILNRSKIYLNGAEFGLSLTERDPLNVQSLPRSVPQKIDATSTAGSSLAMRHLARKNPNLLPSSEKPGRPAAVNPDPVVDTPDSAPDSAKSPETPPAAGTPTQADVDRLNDKYQSQLAALAKDGVARFHFVDYAPPEFVIFKNQIALQMTLRNSLQFGLEIGSIYKRAAQSFDLFLAPQLKELLDKIPQGIEFQTYDFSVLNKLTPDTKGTNEAIEYICPRGAVRQFTDAEITNQQLIDQSVVLVNGVRIALNLQLVE